MTQVTDNDLKELKDLVIRGFSEVKEQINNLDKKVIELSGKIEANNIKIESLEKRLTESNTNLDKRLTESISSLEKGLDKRLANQEFVYRAVFVGVIVSIVGGLFKFLYDCAPRTAFGNHPFS